MKAVKVKNLKKALRELGCPPRYLSELTKREVEMWIDRNYMKAERDKIYNTAVGYDEE